MKENKETAVYYIDVSKTKRNTAGAKAPADIARICAHLKYKRFYMPCFPEGKNKIYQKVWLLVTGSYYWYKLLFTVPENAVIIYQHPSYGRRLAVKMVSMIQKRKHAKFIALIHDLESLRGGIQGVISENKKTSEIGDQVLLKEFDGVICHNEHMRQYLLEQGFEADKLVNLEIFDYLSKEKIQKKNAKSEVPSIAIAGNLAIGKCGYIYDICGEEKNPGLTVNLYGINYEEAKATGNMKYKGSFTPEELPGCLEGDFGLVWDGTSAESCLGNTGNYLRYNNPHKTSLYLTSGMPVVVWSEAAIADFVLKEGVGITVDNLWELEDKIGAVSEEEYQEMCRNARRIASQLRKGYYTETAISRFL